MNIITRKNKRRGFTAIELAVVVAGTATIGLFLPALGTAKAKANRIKCMNNLRTINIAFQDMSGDIEGCTPWQYGAFVVGERDSNQLCKALGANDVQNVFDIESLWLFYTVRKNINSHMTLGSPCDPAVVAKIRNYKVKTFDEYRERTNFIVPRQIQSYAVHMGGDLKAGQTILAMTRNFDGDDAVPTKKPSGDNIKPRLGRSLRSKNLNHAHFIGADEASHSRVMAGLNKSQGHIATADGAVRQSSDASLRGALRSHSISWQQGDGIALDENLTRPRQ